MILNLSKINKGKSKTTILVFPISIAKIIILKILILKYFLSLLSNFFFKYKVLINIITLF